MKTDSELQEIGEKIIGRICQIYDPEIPVNIYELGLIYDIQVSDECDVKIKMTLTSPNCPVAETLPVDVEEKVKEIEDVRNVKVDITFDPPWDKNMMSEEAKLELGMLCEMNQEIINRVANSGLITFDLEEYYPKGKRLMIDLKDWLFEGLVLKEKDFRKSISDCDWSQYQDQYVAINCSTDAIIPVWSYMLISNSISPFAKKIIIGSLEDLESFIFYDIINNLDIEPFKNQRVIIKGCSNFPIPQSAYMFQLLTN